jgi:hypothetical protein
MTVLSLQSIPAVAAPESLTVTADAQLRLGAFIVISQGSRRVSANGTVTNDSIYPVGNSPVGPAQFTVTYDRGNSSQRPLNIVFDVSLAGVSPVNQAGVRGTLSAFDSDLAGASALVPGRNYRVTLTNCITRTCSQTFRVGARLDVTRSSGGGVLTITLPIVANLISSDKL